MIDNFFVDYTNKLVCLTKIPNAGRSYGTDIQRYIDQGFKILPPQENLLCTHCKEAQKEMPGEHSGKYDYSLCWSCNFWDKYVVRKFFKEHARIEGHHYMIAPEEDCASVFKGFSGRKFIIKFHDGRVVTTTNLWHQGEIPEHYKHLLPNNAEFIHEPSLQPQARQ